MTRRLYSSGREAEPRILITPPPPEGSSSSTSVNVSQNGHTPQHQRHSLQQQQHHPLLPQHSRSLASLPVIPDVEDTEESLPNKSKSNSSDSNNNSSGKTSTTRAGGSTGKAINVSNSNVTGFSDNVVSGEDSGSNNVASNNQNAGTNNAIAVATASTSKVLISSDSPDQTAVTPQQSTDQKQTSLKEDQGEVSSSLTGNLQVQLREKSPQPQRLYQIKSEQLPFHRRSYSYTPSHNTKHLLSPNLFPSGTLSINQGLTRSTSQVMSFRESPPRHPVARSHSFGGASIGSGISGMSSASAAATFGSSSFTMSGSIPPVLGGTLRGMPGTRSQQGRSQLVSQYGGVGRSFHRKSPKVPKVPRPARALMVFDSVKRGIGEFIQATHEDIAQLMSSETGTSTAQGRLHETDKQIKSAERYLKRLEFHLAKIDELHDCYMLQQQLREGAKTMAKAYNSSGTLSRKDSIANVKYGYKECSQIMCAIEAQLENMLGTFSCRLKGIAGFARLAPGDVFEVVIKHGPQKWKTKGRIEKNNTQRWDLLDYTFKCLVGDTLNIKASEVRAFKTVVLGQKNCEICQPSSHDAPGHGLFSANPQLMTVSINVHGSLKLSIIISWNPLDGMDETAMYFEPPSRPVGSTRRRPFSVALPNGGLFDSNSDLVAGLGPESRRSIAGPPTSGNPYVYSGLQQRDDSGIYGSATSLPSHRTQDSPLQQASPVMRHTRGGTGPSAGQPFFTPDLRSLSSSRPHTVIALDQQSIRSQPAQLSNSNTGAIFAHYAQQQQPHAYINGGASSRPHSTYLPSQAGFMEGERGTSPLSSASSSSLQAGQQQRHQVVTVSTSSSGIAEVSQVQIPGVAVITSGHEAIEPGLTVEEALGSLTTTLEDFLGQYNELQSLEEVIPRLESLVKKPSAANSRSSSISVSIEGAIEEAFDFLNTEDALEEEDEDSEEGRKTSSKVGSPELLKGRKSPGKTSSQADPETGVDREIVAVSPDSTAKTADSGIASLARRLHEAGGGDSSIGGSSSSPTPPSSGNEQVDQALIIHLTYCDKLLENLGNYGPLKSREFYSLARLQHQATVLSNLVDLAMSGTQVDSHAVLSQLEIQKAVSELWVLCVEQTQLYVCPEKMIAVLESKFGPQLQEHFNIRSIRVFHHMMACMLDVPVYSPELGQSSLVTVYQFAQFFKNQGLNRMETIAKDLHLMDRLRAGQQDTVIKSILTLREDVPSPACLKTLCVLLLSAGTTTKEMAQSAASYLRVIARDKVKRDQIMVILVEGLEDDMAEVRGGCCVALAVIEAEESLDQLVHVSQSDSSSTVRRRAKEALYSLGDAGRKAVEEAQLGAQGFQGLQVKKL